MPGRLKVELTQEQEAELRHIRDHHPKPYLRERAAAILKVAAGYSAREVAHHRLNRPRYHETVGVWIQRYQAQGVAGLHIRAGRGRKPAFSPSARE